jgi:methyl-accepting chemotaxis protein
MDITKLLNLKSIKIRTQVLTVVAVALLGYAAIGVVYYVSNVKQQALQSVQLEATEVVKNANALQTGFLQERRSEKDFFLRTKLKYAKRHAATAEAMTPNFEALMELSHTAEDRARIEEMQVEFSKYVAQFVKVVEARKVIGLTSKEGLRGKLRKAVHEAEVEIKNMNLPILEAALLSMRRSEKDFMLRLDAKYVGRLEKGLAHYLNVVEEYVEDDDDKEYLSDMAEIYFAGFKKVSTSLLAEGKDRKFLSSIFAKIEPQLKALQAQASGQFDTANQDLKSSAETTFMAIIAAMVISAMIAAGLGFLIVRMLSVPGRSKACVTISTNRSLPPLITSHPPRPRWKPRHRAWPRWPKVPGSVPRRYRLLQNRPAAMCRPSPRPRKSFPPRSRKSPVKSLRPRILPKMQ